MTLGGRFQVQDRHSRVHPSLCQALLMGRWRDGAWQWSGRALNGRRPCRWSIGNWFASVGSCLRADCWLQICFFARFPDYSGTIWEFSLTKRGKWYKGELIYYVMLFFVLLFTIMLVLPPPLSTSSQDYFIYHEVFFAIKKLIMNYLMDKKDF